MWEEMEKVVDVVGMSKGEFVEGGLMEGVKKGEGMIEGEGVDEGLGCIGGERKEG